MLPLAVLAALWAALQLARPRLDPLLARLSTRTTRVALSPSALDLSTTALNGVPDAVLRCVPRRRRGAGQGRRLGAWWDAGALVVLVGCVVAQGLLALAGARAVGALVSVLGGGALEGGTAAQLVRRAVGDEALSAASSSQAHSAADSLLLRPLVRPLAPSFTCSRGRPLTATCARAARRVEQVPGLTTPLSLVPTLVAALVVAQGFHELGHALAAAWCVLSSLFSCSCRTRR